MGAWMKHLWRLSPRERTLFCCSTTLTTCFLFLYPPHHPQPHSAPPPPPPSRLFLPWPCKSIHSVYSRFPSREQRSNSKWEGDDLEVGTSMDWTGNDIFKHFFPPHNWEPAPIFSQFNSVHFPKFHQDNPNIQNANSITECVSKLEECVCKKSWIIIF